MRLTPCRALLLLLAAAGLAAAGELTGRAGPFALTLALTPDPPPVGSLFVSTTVRDAKGAPVTGATVTLTASMPAMNMASAPVTAAAGSARGEYAGAVSLSMKGTWALAVKVDAGSQSGSASFKVTTGNPIHQASPAGVRRVWVWLLVLLLAPLVLRLWPARTRGTVTGLVLLLATLALGREVVRTFRAPGQMSVIESQAMDMSAMKPPVGVVPVVVETVQPRSFEATINYSGSVVPYAQQDVYPRVAGVIVDMPVYPGDRVRRGQVLARLDTRELDSRRNEAVLAHLAAQDAAGAMRSDVRGADAAAQQAQAEAQMAALRITQMASDRAAAETMVRRAGHEQAAAEAKLKQALAQVDAARASRRSAAAMSEESAAMVGQAKAEQGTAGGMVTQAGEEVIVAQRAVAESQSMLDAAQAGRDRADNDLAAMRAELPQAEAEVAGMQADVTYWDTEVQRMARLLKEGAVSQEEYDKEKSMRDGAAAKLAKAQSMVAGTRNKIKSDEAMLRQAGAELAAAGERRASAEALVRAAQAKLAQAKSELSGRATMVGQREAGVRSKAAMEEEATQMVTMREAETESMRADLRTAAVAVEEAKLRLQSADSQLAQAKADRERAEAMVREKLAMAGAVARRESEMANRAQQAKAAAFTAATLSSYTELRAELDGLVTERVTSPATLVQPGTLLMRVAQIDKVRLQAAVAETDAGAVRPGAPVTILARKDPLRHDAAQVSRVFPAADPASRTVLVEALVANPDRFYLPGEFIALKIATGAPRPVLSVPVTALVQTLRDPHAINGTTSPAVWVVGAARAAAKADWTCSMHPEVHQDRPGKCPKCKMDLIPANAASGAGTAHQVAVVLGRSSGDRVEIVRGLNAGDQVIVSGQDNLREGTAVSPTAGLLAAEPVAAAAPAADRAARPDRPAPPPAAYRPPSAAPTAAKRTLYTCPMHPEIVRNKPGACPKCGMDLEPQS